MKNEAGAKNYSIYLYTLLFCLGVCSLFVCLFVSNKHQNSRSIGPKFFVGLRVFPGKIYGWSNFQKFASNKFDFWKFWKSTKFFFLAKFLFFSFYNVHKKNLFTIEIDDDHEKPQKPSINIFYLVCLRKIA